MSYLAYQSLPSLLGHLNREIARGIDGRRPIHGQGDIVTTLVFKFLHGYDVHALEICACSRISSSLATYLH